MGNCFALQEKAIKVMRTDGKILEYKAPVRVHEVLSEYAGHAVSDTLHVARHLRPDANMVGGHFYYLLPLPPPPQESESKLRSSSNLEVKAGQEAGVVRIKLIISKQELEMMLRKGAVSVDDVLAQLQKKPSKNGIDKLDGESNGDSRGWKPVLESIPESD
ncbi:hypothetical protein RJ639_002089 [Escallonia herrerae]|uniref:Uncharacterized protein n=1 Tax=Escallonia herrerae TaxID=1293975 RepID=A0AA88XJC4_9ASTE|nr:hypothetical protein RJ639_002089 [Escallonia herrerae]